jgi:SAM-dependent methyltransferase
LTVTEGDVRIEEIRNFWDDQARLHREELAATTPDPLAKELELQAIQKALDPALDVLEVGCGNGYNLFRLSGWFRSRLVGIDFAQHMIDAARQAASRREDRARFSFHVRSVLDDLEFLGEFSQIFTDRCLINLPSHQLQVEAVENLCASCDRAAGWP